MTSGDDLPRRHGAKNIPGMLVLGALAVHEISRTIMGMPRAFVTRRIPDAGLDVLRPHCDVTVNPHDRPPTRDELLAAVRGCDGLVPMLADRVDAALLDAAPRLRVVASFAVGLDNVDVPAAGARGVWVTNTPGVLTDATAELAWALVLAAARRIAEGDRHVREGRFTGWAPMLMLGLQLQGKTLGVVGAGRIGQAVARKGPAFGMRVVYCSRTPKPELERETGAARRDVDALLAESDVVVLACPLTPETRHLIGRERLARMKRTAVLVNVARGPVVDEAALARALQDGAIAGAGLDVYEREPEIHPGLLACPNAVLLPHVGSGTHDTRRRMAVMTCENCLAGVQGRVPPQAVNAAEVAASRRRIAGT
jgi:glyoxylate reductase